MSLTSIRRMEQPLESVEIGAAKSGRTPRPRPVWRMVREVFVRHRRGGDESLRRLAHWPHDGEYFLPLSRSSASSEYLLRSTRAWPIPET